MSRRWSPATQAPSPSSSARLATRKLKINLTAQSIVGGCAITPNDTVDFGNVAIGTSYGMMVKITNNSVKPWEVNVEKILEDADKGVFVFSSFEPGIKTVPEHGELLVPLEFKPNHAGLHYAALSIPAPEFCQPAVLPLVGKGVDQVLECEPRVLIKDSSTGQEKWECLLDFGFVNPNAKATASIGFKNLGNSDIDVSALALTQDLTKGGDAFAIEPDAEGKTPDVITVKKGESVKVTLSFLPTLLGQYNGKLDFESTDQKRPTGYFLLQGTGGGPAIELQPTDRVDFGPVAVNTHQKRRVIISNVGTDIQGTTDDNLKLIVPDAATACTKNTDCTANNSNICQRGMCWNPKQAELEVVQGDPAEFTLVWPPVDYESKGIAAGESVEVTVTFAPIGGGDKKALLKVYSNDPAKPVAITEIYAAGAVMPPCNYEIIPPQLNYGNVEAGKSLVLSFEIRNKATKTTDQCLVSTLGFSRDTSPTFTLVDGAVNGKYVNGGESLRVPVRFSPKVDGSYGGSVEFYISSPDAPDGKVPMAGTTKKGCMLIAPNELDFGVIQKDCNSRDRTFTIYNVCTTAQSLQSIEMQQGGSTEFKVTSTPMFPYNLAAGASVDFKVRYSPVDVGQDQATIAVKSSQVTVIVPISGRGDTTAIQTDIFAQDPQPKVDVLFIVDNSGSMSDEQSSLGSNFDSFIKFALAQGVDYHIAVTTTGVDQAHGGSTDNGSPPDENGCIIPLNNSRPKIINPQTSNGETVFKQNVNVGTDGNYTEFLIRPAYLALTSPNLTGCNNGFLREEATLAVVVVSDAGDQDDTPVGFYVNALLTIKGFRHQNMFSFSGIVRPDDENTCSQSGDGSNAFYPRVLQMINSTGGVRGNICEQDWNQTLETLGQNAFGYRTRFFLSNVPDLSQPIVVKVDGVPYEMQGPSGDDRWKYNGTVTAVDFELLAVPEPGSTIEVSYHVACLR
ncbi:MAG: choice-of-anchor D domain-containing protein [Myxococcales bacterium]